MTESEKYAKELIEEYKHIALGKTVDGYAYYMETFEAKECAKITVKRIIAGLETYDKTTERELRKEFNIDFNSFELQNMEQDFRFFNKVLTAIDKY